MITSFLNSLRKGKSAITRSRKAFAVCCSLLLRSFTYPYLLQRPIAAILLFAYSHLADDPLFHRTQHATIVFLAAAPPILYFQAIEQET